MRRKVRALPEVFYPYEDILMDMHRRFTKSETDTGSANRMSIVRRGEDDERTKRLAIELKEQQKMITTGAHKRADPYYLFI